MNRREFISNAGFAAATATLLAPKPIRALEPAAPALHTTRRLVLACPYPQSPGGAFDGARQVAIRLQRLMGDNTAICVTSQDAGSLELIATGAAQITLASEAANIASLPAVAFVAGLPGRFAHSPAVAQLWLSGHGESLWHEVHANSGTQPIYAGLEGYHSGVWSRQPLTTLSGLKVAADPGLRAEVLKGLGATPVALSPSAITPALVSGEIDAAEMASLQDALTLGVVHIAPYCREQMLARNAAPLALTFAPDLWASIPASLRSAIRQDVTSHVNQARRRSIENTPAMKRALAQAFGCVFEIPPAKQRAEIDRLSEAVIAHHSGLDVISEKISGSSMATNLL